MPFISEKRHTGARSLLARQLHSIRSTESCGRASLRKYSKRKRSDAAIRRRLRHARESSGAHAPPLAHSLPPGQPSTAAPRLQHWRFVAIAVYNRIFEDEVFGRSAQLAYYWLFSLFPLLIFLTALLAYVPLPNFFEDLFAYLQNVLPRDAFAMLYTTFTEIRTQ